MAGFKELQNWVMSRLFPGWSEGNRRPDGGTSCYRPVQRKNPGNEQTGAAAGMGTNGSGQQIPVAHSGFTDMTPPAGSYAAGLGGDPYGYGAAQAAQQEYRQAWAGSREAPAGDNISYMPGAYAPGAGNSYTHVEHIMAVTSLSTCYEAIECMKNGETVIITMDTIGNESESIRCQDMLAGAAFTLGCTVRTLQAGTVIIIASAGVKLLPEQQSRSWSVPGGTPAPVRSTADAGDREPRSRRVSMNSVGWENAFSKENRDYNPYTGKMPSPAENYSSYGGYGSGGQPVVQAAARGSGTYGPAGGDAYAGWDGYAAAAGGTGYYDGAAYGNSGNYGNYGNASAWDGQNGFMNQAGGNASGYGYAAPAGYPGQTPAYGAYGY